MERLPSRWYMRLAAPLIRGSLRRRFRPGQMLLSDFEDRSGPYAFAVRALGRLPIAPRLRRLIDASLQSSVLPRTSKLLAFAIVARGLGCPVSEAEALLWLQKEGWSEERSLRALDHLGASDLDTDQRAIARLARESIWYQAADVQRKARGVLETLGDERFVELIGVLAVANAVCRFTATISKA